MKNTKKALFLSLLSIVLCFSMLIGSTFAWFTDTATTGVNTIQAGTLDIDLVDKDGKTLVGSDLQFVSATATDGMVDPADVLWEPGATYELEPVTLVNLGNLAAKYQIALTLGNEEKSEAGASLAEVIDVIINGQTRGTLKDILAANGGIFNEGTLMPAGDETGADEATYGTVQLHMQETAGNEYQKLTLNTLALTVYATQLSYENDSFDDRYDADAPYPVNTIEQAAEALANAKPGDTILLGSITADKLEIPATAKGITLLATEDTALTNITMAAGASDITFVNFKNLYLIADQSTIESFGTITVKDCTFNNTSFLVKANSSTDLVVEDCTFIKASRIYDNYGGFEDVTIRNCTFEGQSDGPVLICGHAGSGRPVTSMTIDGCTFTNVTKSYLVRSQCMSSSATFTFTNNTIVNWSATDSVPITVDNKGSIDIKFVVADNTRDGAAYNDYTCN